MDSLEGYTQREIAQRNNISISTVKRALGKVTLSNDYQLAIKGCSVMIQEYAKYQDYLQKKLKELNNIETEDNKERIAIIKLQTDLRRDILTFGAQGEFIEGIKKIRDNIGSIEQNT